ncbi:MAG: sigma 54-interacting transcriptional regulator, partial [Pollutimonas bauzanensis]
RGSGRADRAFVAVNCAAIPEALIESELFGHLPGSFSGALTKAKRGLIQEADTGTLFLDEIGDMPRKLQSRLLRVLSEREVLPIGATRPLPVSIRVIAATHHDLEALVRAGRFRDDLYYRLSGACFQLPPLRQRKDLPWLMRHMLDDGGGNAAPELSPAAAARLAAHHWPGNLRELRNVLDYACAVCESGRIGVDDLPELFQARSFPGATRPLAPPAVHGPDADLLRRHLAAAHWNITRAARQLGISRMTLYRRMKRLGIVSPNQQDNGDPAAAETPVA